MGQNVKVTVEMQIAVIVEMHIAAATDIARLKADSVHSAHQIDQNAITGRDQIKLLNRENPVVKMEIQMM